MLDASYLSTIKITQPVVIEEMQADLYMAIDRALERAAQALGRKLARKREHGRTRLNSLLADDPNLNHA